MPGNFFVLFKLVGEATFEKMQISLECLFVKTVKHETAR